MKENWTCKKLGEVCDILDSKRKPITKRDRKPGNIPYYGATGIQDYVSDFIFDGRFLLVGEDGAKWGKNDNTAYIIEGKSWVNNHAHILKMHDEVIDAYVRYFLNGKDLNNYITGAIVQKLTQAALASISIPIPPIAIQSRIVAKLDLLQSIIDKQKVQLKELDNLAQSIFYDMFGDPAENEKGWEVKRMEELCEVSSSKRVLVKDMVDSGIPFLRGTELTALRKAVSSKFVNFTMFITPEHYERVKAITGVPKKGDILIPSINSEGITWIVDTDESFYFKDGRVIWVHVNTHAFDSQYLSVAISKILNTNYSVLTSGATFLELKLFIIRDLMIPVPPLSLQQSFAAKIESIERQKASISKSIEETQKLFDYTMDKYFG